MKTRMLRLISIAMMLSIIVSALTPVFAISPDDGIEPQSSDYISSTYATISSKNGVLTVDFDITAKRTMTSLGALFVKIYTTTSTTPVKTFNSDTTPSLMGYNCIIYDSSVSYKGTVGKGYYATVTFRAADSTGSHTITSKTGTITAK